MQSTAANGCACLIIVASFQRQPGFENEIMGNPYESPDVPADKHPDVVGNPAVSRRPLSFCLLLLLFTSTVVMAIINLIQEASGSGASQTVSSLVATCMIAGFSGLSQVPGLVIAGWRWKGSSNSLLPMLFAAYIIALTGVGAFTVFVSQTEPSDSMNSAAHMHIFFFPVIHLVLSTVLYFIASLFTMGLMAYSRYGKRNGDVKGRGKGIENGDTAVDLDLDLDLDDGFCDT